MRSKVLRYTLHTIDTSAMLQSSSGRAQKPATKFAKKRARHSLSSSSTGLETMPKSPGHQTNLCQQEPQTNQELQQELGRHKPTAQTIPEQRPRPELKQSLGLWAEVWLGNPGKCGQGNQGPSVHSSPERA